MITAFAILKKTRYVVLHNYICTIWLIALFMFTFSFSFSQDYSLDYGAFCDDGSVSTTTDYEVVDMVKSQGASEELQGSTDYSVETVTGMEDEPLASVPDWMYY